MSSIDRVTCPFEPSHVVEKRRFQAHLIKCKRNLPVNHDFVQCTFYQLHYVKKGKLAEHLATCDHRLEKEANRVMWEAEASQFAKPNLLCDEALAQQPSTPNYEDLHENWDTVNWPVFQSERLITDSIHMTVPQGLTKSQRKEFLLRERERLRNIADRQKNYNVQEVKDTREDNVATSIPRMPAKPVRPPGRIAARFPEQLEPLESERSNDGLSDSAHTRNSGGNVYRGAGRGILGWSL